LLTYSNIIAIFTRTNALKGIPGIAPPEVLKSNTDRIAYNDNLPIDDKVDQTIPKVRRTELFMNLPSGENFDALPFRVALIYLQRMGIEPKPDPADPKAFWLGKARLRPLQPNDGAYAGANMGGFQILLDFKRSDQFTRFSISDVLSGNIPPGTFRDKIVLLGVNAQSVFDERVTPTRREHRGIEVQALAVNQLLRMALDGEKPLRSLSDWQEDAWVFLWCLVGGAIGYRVRSPWRFGPESLACLFALGGIDWLAFSRGWWLPLAAPAVAYAPAALLVTSYIAFQQRSMRAVLMKLYSRHVSKEIAESIWENRESFLDGQRPLAQKLVVTVLFTDLKGFSTISEKMQPYSKITEEC
jgi:adenylate cyclase